jgi:hypothetical protein
VSGILKEALASVDGEQAQAENGACLRATHRQVELALAAGILLLALVFQPGSGGSVIRRQWGKLYEERVIDKREYIEHWLSLF